MKISEIEKAGENGFALYRIPAICRTARGTILTAYECRLSPNDWDTRAIGFKRSIDGGESFSERVIIASDDKLAVNNPVLISGADGTVWILYQKNYERTFVRISSDDGVSFGSAIEITSAFEGFSDIYPFNVCAVGPGHGIELSDGRLVVPIWLANNPERFHYPSATGAICSRDRGISWETAGMVFPNADCRDMYNTSEACVVQLTDRSVMMNLRHDGSVRRRAISVASDDFVWSSPHYQNELTDPVCCASIARAGEKLIFTNCDDENERVNLTLKFSDDDGKSWRDPMLIYKNAGYSDVCASPDGRKIYCFFEHDNMKAMSVAVIEL